jgi:hypothetical protein
VKLACYACRSARPPPPRARGPLTPPQTSDERALQAERALLLSQKSQLNPVSDFVLDSKLGRQLVGLDKRLAALAAARAAPPRESAAAASRSRNGVGLCTAAVCALWWGRPLAALPAGWLSPLGWTLSLGAGARGHLGVLPWALLCSLLAERALTALALATGVLVPAPAKGLLAQIFG